MTELEMIQHLARRGLLPSDHNLSIWQHSDNSGRWGVCVESPHSNDFYDAHGDTLQEALEELVKLTSNLSEVTQIP